ncbi:galactose ABC transporter substrate-binding protein [Clostridium sp.]|uniref:galactose ABC transporter substrate-binding protein n=1 Tax=Clostridium sp. TaxID=1506 RepID=UPI00284E5BE8|nr:galactose ABC transporter substrate-binding protein [Clostridium sp.]MDR3597375.1 galactose ABC transporter substrate-binding protein [Clostridium sp.]
MNTLKKITLLATLLILLTSIFIDSNKNNVYTASQVSTSKQIKAAVIFYTFDDPYLSLVRKSLEAIENKPGSNVNYTFYSGQRNQDTQNEIIDSVVDNNYDILLVNFVSLDKNTIQSTINKVKQKNIPIIVFNALPFTVEPIKSYNKAIIIASNAKQAGTLEGNSIITEWNSNKNIMDKNGDGILQYYMLKGPANNTDTVERSRYSISTLNDAGIETQEVISIFCNWDEKCAEDYTDSLFLGYGNKIEAIISNNDAMAIGAIKALQKYGYNNDDKSKHIPTFGIDGIPEAIELIKKGIMDGTVFQDPNELAEAIYTVGNNLVYNLNPLENTNYKFDETGVAIELPFHEYKR